MRGTLRWTPLLLLLLLAGCVDFVDPVGLRLARSTSLQISFDVTTDPYRAVCSGAVPESGDSAVVCVSATLTAGLSHLGERFQVIDDTLRVMGVPILPTMDEDSVLHYEARFLVPSEELEEIPFTASFPLVEGMEAPLPDLRWFAIGRAGPDTLTRQLGEGVRLRIDLPEGASIPPPTSDPFWRVDASGSGSTTVMYSGPGTPRREYDFPADVLSALGGDRFSARLTWNRTRSTSQENVRLIVRFNEMVRWTLLTPEPPGDGAGDSRGPRPPTERPSGL